MRVRLASLAAAVAVLAALAAGCGGGEDAVRIGVLTDCQGPFHAYEDAQLSGAELPFLRRGARLVGPGPSAGVTGLRIAGRRVELVRGCQESGEHTVFIEETRRLIETEHVDAIVGGASVVSRELAHHYPDVPFVNAFWDEQEVTLRSPAHNLFRFSPDFAQDAAGLGAYAYRQLGWRRAAIVAGDQSAGWDGAAAFTAEFCSLGGSVVATSYATPITSSSDVVGRALSRRPDGVAAFLTPFEDQPRLVGTLLSRLRSPRRLVTWSQSIEAGLPTALGPRLNGIVATTWLPPTPSAALRKYHSLYHAAYPGLPAWYGDQSWVLSYYDAAEAVLTALGRVGGGEVRAGLIEELGRLDLDLPGGRVTLDRNRQAVRDGYLARVDWARGPSHLQPVAVVPHTEQTFGGLLSAAPPPSRDSQPCVKARPPAWAR